MPNAHADQEYVMLKSVSIVSAGIGAIAGAISGVVAGHFLGGLIAGCAAGAIFGQILPPVIRCPYDAYDAPRFPVWILPHVGWLSAIVAAVYTEAGILGTIVGCGAGYAIGLSFPFVIEASLEAMIKRN